MKRFTWCRTTYRWTADGFTATTELTDVELNADGTGYEVPSQPQCDECHNGRMDGVLGFEAVALSSPGASGLAMPALTAQNLLTAPPTGALVVPGNAVESAALELAAHELRDVLPQPRSRRGAGQQLLHAPRREHPRRRADNRHVHQRLEHADPELLHPRRRGDLSPARVRHRVELRLRPSTPATATAWTARPTTFR